MSSAQEKGYRIPDDVSIVSFDGSPVCAYCSPPLSVIQQPMEEMGERAALMLIGYGGAVGDATQGPIVISSKLVKRKSMAGVAR
ncbi:MULTISPECIES: substrate-binding domain-containing protein [Rhizobium]|nr:substrate-binding domain-containing protein [Rhizobium favelukesii]UFS85183.1 substrate-binding domain-containing protein [Rhizobium sp. T136]